VKDLLHVYDDFYTNPHDVRNNAISQEFSVSGNYPGMRTDPVPEEHGQYLKTFFEENILHRKITYWPSEYNSAFQYTTQDCKTWVHHDATKWAGLIYLTPTPGSKSGTTIYSRVDNSVYEWDGTEETEYNYTSELTGDLSKWREELTIENRFNRLILYRGALYHRSTTPGFGRSKFDGRLFQVFFFDTDY